MTEYKNKMKKNKESVGRGRPGGAKMGEEKKHPENNSIGRYLPDIKSRVLLKSIQQFNFRR